MSQTAKKEIDLDQFTGTGQYYKYGLTGAFVYTDGIQYMAENMGAYWLIDLVASYQHKREVKALEFQAWKMTVNEDSSAVVVLEDGDENEVLRQELEYTDFLKPKIMIWLQNGVLMLPSEY